MTLRRSMTALITVRQGYGMHNVAASRHGYRKT